MVNKQEFESIFRRYYDSMYRLALRMLEDEAESKDIVSDVFASLLDGGIDLQSATLQGFLLRCVRNRCINLQKHQQKVQQHKQALVVDMFDISRQEEEEQEQLNALRHYIVNQLPELSQEILRLRYRQGLKYREIAEVLGVSEVTVHNHLSQSLKQMKTHFKIYGYGIQ